MINYGDVFKNIDEMITSDCFSCRATRVTLILGVFLGVLSMTLLVISLLTGGSLKALMLLSIGAAAGYFISAIRRNVRASVAEGVAVNAEKQIEVLNKRVARLGDQVIEKKQA